MIEVCGLNFAYPGASARVLRDVNVRIGAGEVVLLVGASGSGKSTLLRCFNGLVPHFHGGSFSGRVIVDGQDTLRCQPHDLAQKAGMVFQDPEAQSVADTVEDELAFGMENLGVPRLTMRKRVEEVLDILGIAHLKRRRLETLSGGELQRVVIGAVLTMQPKVLLLDEPTSQLDPQAAEEVLTVVQRLNTDLGLTIVIAEHRLERVAQYAERVFYLNGDGSVLTFAARDAMRELPLSPPVARLGRALGWEPLPLSIREGRRFVERLPVPREGRVEPPRRDGQPSLLIQGAHLSYGPLPAVRGVSLAAFPGEMLALMGRNGAGKTSLLRACAGLLPLKSGSIQVLDADVSESSTEELAEGLALVPQEPASILFKSTVEAEIEETLSGTGRAGSVEEALREWRLEPLRQTHPRDLSAGERQRAALASMLAGSPSVLLLDEPTRGMDYETKHLLVDNLKRRCREGATVVLASHDVELVASCADRIVLLADGEVVAEGSARDVLTESITFSTQVNKLFGGGHLTVEDVLQSRESEKVAPHS